MPSFLDTAIEIVSAQEAARANFRRGVGWSAMGPMAPRVERVEDVAERLAQEHEDAVQFRASPRGRFLRAVDALAEVGAYDEEVLRLRGFYGRTLSPLNGPLSADALPALAECIRVLAHITGSDARAGVDALTDLLADEGPAVGEAA